MAKPVLHGPSYSVYVRAARLALEEKGIAYDLNDFSFVDGDAMVEHRARHPFAKVPALDHGDFRLFETVAIERYIDEAFDGPPLQPESSQDRARMVQIQSAVDSYLYWPMVREVYTHRVSRPAFDHEHDPAVADAALPKVIAALEAILELKGDGPYLAGARLSLADTHLAPMFYYFQATPEGPETLDKYPPLSDWWSRVRSLPSMATTEPEGVWTKRFDGSEI